MTLRGSVCLIAMASCSSLALAQTTMTAAQSGGKITLTFAPDGKEIALRTGRPYSVTRTSERIPTGGVRMVEPPVRMYRDAQGRTRTEQLRNTVPMQDPFLNVEIVDPVAGSYYLLDSQNRVAHRLAAQTRTSPAVGHNPLYEFAAKPSTDKMKDGSTMITEPLGLRMVEGVGFCVEKRTTTYPAGSRWGNSRPVEGTEEVWSSWDDGLPFYLFKRADPNGEGSASALQDVSLSDPDPALFLPPVGYRVVEETGKFEVTIPGQPPPPGAPHTMKPLTALTDLPFSAEIIGETQKSLPDGTVFSRTHRTLFYRDAMGRTSRATHIQDSSGKDNIVATGIADVVAGYRYELNQAKMTAHRTPVRVQFQPASSAIVPAAKPTSTETLRGGIVGVQEWLGTQSIDGFETYGQRSTLKYPPGTLGGNDRPVVAVIESWTSPILGTQFLFKISDPQNGNATMALKNLKFEEPDPMLFRVPQGYQVVDDSAPGAAPVDSAYK